MQQQTRTTALATVAISLSLVLATPVQADEKMRELAHGLGMIGKILEEKNRADREGREAQVDVQGLADSTQEFYRQQDQRLGRRTYSNGDSYEDYGRVDSNQRYREQVYGDDGSANRYGVAPNARGTYDDYGTGQRQQQGQRSQYGYLNPTPAQKTRHQRMLDALASQNQSLRGRGQPSAPPAQGQAGYTADQPPASNRNGGSSQRRQAGYRPPAGYPPAKPPVQSTGTTSNGGDQRGYESYGQPPTSAPRCVKWGKPTADSGGGVFGTGQAQKCLKTEF